MLCQQKEKPVQAKNKSAGYKTIRQTAVKNIVPQSCRCKENAPIIRNIPRLPIFPGRRKKRKDSKRKPPKRQERNSINQVEKKISLQKKISLFLFHCKPFFPTHPLPYVLPRTAPIPCVLSSFYVQYRKYKPIIQAAGSSMKLEKSGQRAKMDISIKSI